MSKNSVKYLCKVGENMIRDNLIEVLHEMEEVTKLFKLEPFDIYIVGGGACIESFVKAIKIFWIPLKRKVID